jgi:murein L,D-transpeptidase YafK
LRILFRPKTAWRKAGGRRVLWANAAVAILTLSCFAHAGDQLPQHATADRVVVIKHLHTLTLLDHGKLLKEYKVALGGDPLGPKIRQGDHKTPEGIYTLDHRNEHSHYYRSIHISYPNAQDWARSRNLGVAPGGDVMIHGLPNGYGWIGKAHRARDWTDGCIAVTNQEMDEIWRAVPPGTSIEIRP